MISKVFVAVLVGTVGPFCAGEGLRPEPTIELFFRDARQVQELVQKNGWFREFRNSPLYEGGLNQLAPVLFSMVDKYGPSTDTWKGYLLDTLYGQILGGKPALIEYYATSTDVQSPVVITFGHLSGAERTILSTFARAFRSAEPVEKENHFVITPVEVRGRKWALGLSESCFTISRDIDLAAVAGSKCSSLTGPSADVTVKFHLAYQIPVLAHLKEKFFSLGDVAEIHLQWNASNFSFRPVDGFVSLQKQNAAAVAGTSVSPNVLRALPASTFFFGALGVPASGKRKATNLTVFYVPSEVDRETSSVEDLGASDLVKTKLSISMAFLVQKTQTINQTLTDLISSLTGDPRKTLLTRPVCGDQVVLTAKPNLLHQVEENCGQQEATPGRKAQADKLAKLSPVSAVYLSPGKLLARLIDVAWKNKMAGKPLPEKLVQSQKLAENLPEYFFTGIVENGRLILKPADNL
ncbi:MAG: hypothetical protein C5B49_11100 [Bdellovibrio sp.]|nr:MAG: hypothetical protein C5B49_11100 [Bdellovibrio sp.]